MGLRTLGVEWVRPSHPPASWPWHGPPAKPKILRGWECPVCHIGVAPHMPFCPKCAQDKSVKSKAPAEG